MIHIELCKVNVKRNLFAVALALLLAAGVLSGCGEEEQSWTNEGSTTNPVPLSIGVAHNGVIGGLPPYDSSFYKFTATGTNHTITLSSVPDDLMWLQGDITFTTLMNQCDTNLGGAPESCATTTNALTGGTQYGIQVYNWDISQVSFTITVN